MKIHTTKCDKCGKTSRECQAEESKTALGRASIFEPEMIRVTMTVSPWWPLGMTATQAQDAIGFDFCSTDCVIQFFTERARTPNEKSTGAAGQQDPPTTLTANPPSPAAHG